MASSKSEQPDVRRKAGAHGSDLEDILCFQDPECGREANPGSSVPIRRQIVPPGEVKALPLAEATVRVQKQNPRHCPASSTMPRRRVRYAAHVAFRNDDRAIATAGRLCPSRAEPGGPRPSLATWGRLRSQSVEFPPTLGRVRTTSTSVGRTPLPGPPDLAWQPHSEPDKRNIQVRALGAHLQLDILTSHTEVPSKHPTPTSSRKFGPLTKQLSQYLIPDNFRGALFARSTTPGANAQFWRTAIGRPAAMQVLNFGAVKSRAQTIRRQQQSIRTRTSVSYDDDADASVFKKRTQQTVWEARLVMCRPCSNGGGRAPLKLQTRLNSALEKYSPMPGGGEGSSSARSSFARKQRKHNFYLDKTVKTRKGEEHSTRKLEFVVFSVLL